jgi:CRISPR-associated protein Cas2
MHVVVAYDIIDDRRRVRLARFLIGYLQRVQKSVFEGEIEQKRYLLMKEGIDERIEHVEATVRIYQLCGRCKETVDVIGTGIWIEEPGGDFIL